MNTDVTPQEALPIYGEKPTKPGMYLGLLHGRDHPLQQMNDWGFNGPTMGPLRWVHTTYASTIRVAFESAADGQRYFGDEGTEHELELSVKACVTPAQPHRRSSTLTAVGQVLHKPRGRKPRRPPR